MSKHTEKRLSYNKEVVEVLEKEYGLSKNFIRQSIRGDKKSLTAETIRKNYYKMANATTRAIDDFKKNLKINNINQ
ncbi:conserved hypothetical protein [Tenacibaculum dicentrarchi]|nr:conserved hypothetical protein [Tenacibaculum dicentrarchi]